MTQFYLKYPTVNKIIIIGNQFPLLFCIVKVGLKFTCWSFVSLDLQKKLPAIKVALWNVCLISRISLSLCSQSILPDAIAGVVHNAPALDTQWIETTSKKAALKLEKLDTDLKNYKSNSIKESIR